MLQALRSWIRFPMGSFDFSVDLMLAAGLSSWGRQFSNSNEYQESSCGKGRTAHKAENSQQSLSRLSRKCGSLDVLHLCMSPRPVKRLAFLYLVILFDRCVCVYIHATNWRRGKKKHAHTHTHTHTLSLSLSLSLWI
jgi:hypothetical protein